MGRTEPTIVKPPAAFRRDARAKRARATINKVIPALLSAHPRARRGIERSELIVDPAPLYRREAERQREKGDPGQHASPDDDIKETRRATGIKSGGRRRKNVGYGGEQTRLRPGHEKEARHADLGHESQAKTNHSGNNLGDAADGPRITLHVADTLTAAHALLHYPGSSPSSPARNRHRKKQQQQEQGQQYGSDPVHGNVEGAHHHAPSQDAAKANNATKIGILNMASPLSPGGGFLNGATSQEESLCMRTTLLPALRDEFYRLPELGVVYTPDVLVFRSAAASSSPPQIPYFSQPPSTSRGDSEPGRGETDGGGGDDVLAKNDRWFVDIVSAAMLRMPETEDGRYASAADRELAARKMRAVLRVFAARGCTRVVLGAWGCGAYGNPVGEIAEAWRRVLRPDVVDGRNRRSRGDESRNGEKKPRNRDWEQGKEKEKGGETWGAFIEDVVFAIKDPSVATTFTRVFGDLITSSTSSSSSSSSSSTSTPVHDGADDSSHASTLDDEDEDPVEAVRVRELREKIAQLEVQVQQARGPHLKTGLESVLTGLRKQLPPDDDDEPCSDPVCERSDASDDEDETDDSR